MKKIIKLSFVPKISHKSSVVPECFYACAQCAEHFSGRTCRSSPKMCRGSTIVDSRLKRAGMTAWSIILSSLIFIQFANASEVIIETHSKVIIREHPKTGKPYVVIAPENLAERTGFFLESKKFSRPDYRLLDPKVKSGEIPYDGPYSDSKRIYIFAASLTTLGAGGLAGAALMPATGAAAASGGAGYLATGGTLAAGTAATAATTLRSNPKKDNFIQTSESKSIYKGRSGEGDSST